MLQEQGTTLIPLLRISIFCRIGSTELILPIRPKDGILNRGIRVPTVHFGTYKKPACVSKQDVSQIETLRYIKMTKIGATN